MWHFPGRRDMIRPRSPHPNLNSTRDVDFAPSPAVPLIFARAPAPDDAQIPRTACSPAPEQVDFGHPSIDPTVSAAALALSWHANPHPLLAWSTAQVMSPSAPDAGQTHFKNEDKKAAQPRQIRFVSNDGQPHAKRRRINAACSTCRRRKTRCSGERPICKTCSDNGHSCLGYKDSSQNQHASLGDLTSPRWEEDQSQQSPSISPHDSQRPIDELPAFESGWTPTLAQQDSVESATSQKSGVIDTGPHATRSEIDKLSEGRSPASNFSMGSRNRVPYFRYFGPTAIVPGFKQMVVQVKEHRRSGNSLSLGSPASTQAGQSGSGAATFGYGTTPSISGAEPRTSIDMPFYDANNPLPNNPLITLLCETFFVHLGCNFPFLQRDRFLKDLEEKRVDAILVDAVCAIAARFSNHPILSTLNEQPEADVAEVEGQVRKSARGQPFAQRAMSAVVETFSCPTMAVVQASLLLAYEEFGSNRDSGLWMYLGIAIRMAQDLGMQKIEGLKFEGRTGPTPKTAKSGEAGKQEEKRRETALRASKRQNEIDPSMVEDQMASERERIDTFWAVFFLDRVISSGTGRPVTLRDKDIEISFPSDDSTDGWPAPFPPLIRVIHLYGRVTDILNNIKEVNHVTPETLKKLASLESDLTGIYQRLSPKLHFNALNFQHYVKSEQGANFILLHIWFHTLIVLLHQPTLLHSFEGRIQQLFPNSRELSMSSAKTIADIIAFAELIDMKSYISNPFVSQCSYVAASAFLMESAIHTASQPPSRATSPPPSGATYPTTRSGPRASKIGSPGGNINVTSGNEQQKATGKHSLLASAANQNYQRCYQALKTLESYWAGTKYILTVLEQKAKGIVDPLLYTTEDIDSAVEQPRSELTFTTPGWRRAPHSASMGVTAAGGYSRLRSEIMRDIPGSPMDPSHAIGWSLTGTTNSPSPNLSFLFQTTNGEVGSPLNPHSLSQYNPALQSLPMETATATANVAANTSHPSYRQSSQHTATEPTSNPYQQSLMPPPLQKFSPLPSEPASASEAEMLLGLHSPYSTSATRPTTNTSSVFDEPQPLPPSQSQQGSVTSTASPYNYSAPHNMAGNIVGYLGSTPGGFGDMMMIESQDIDMTSPNGGVQFPLGGDLIPWLEYLPQDVLSYFGDPQTDSMVNPSGPGPPSMGSSAPPQ